jgi:predicted enzyme related to lactoylglutathione lyase
MSGKPVAWFEIIGSEAKRLRDRYGAPFGWSMEVMDADRDGHVVGPSHGLTAV